MKIYLASRFDRQEEMRNYAAILRSYGHEITSKWLSVDDAVAMDPNTAPNPSTAASKAMADIVDLNHSDLLLVFNDDEPGRGGNHVEYGYALGLGLRPILIGSRPTIFHWITSIRHFYTWSDFERFFIEWKGEL